MADRKQTPDIISELMLDNSKTVHHNTGKPAKQFTSKMVKQDAGKKGVAPVPGPASEEEKVKVTFYVSPEAVEALELLWMQRRREVEPQHRGAISKSKLVEEAILLLCHGKADSRKGETAKPV